VLTNTIGILKQNFIQEKLLHCCYLPISCAVSSETARPYQASCRSNNMSEVPICNLEWHIGYCTWGFKLFSSAVLSDSRSRDSSVGNSVDSRSSVPSRGFLSSTGSRPVLSNVYMYSGTIHWCLWRCGCHHTVTTTTTTTTTTNNNNNKIIRNLILSNTVPCFKEIFWKYLTVLRRTKMSLVLQFELKLKIGSIIFAYGGRRVGQGWLKLFK
jgi:hypothetical protein